MKGAPMRISPPSTYLNGHANGWPQDPKAEDTFDLPPRGTIKEPHPSSEPEYSAEFTCSGDAILVLYPPAKIIARFDTFADATTAAQALNEHKGY